VNKTSESPAQNTRYRFPLVVAIGLALLATIAGYLLFLISTSNVAQVENLGSQGDLLGGVLNPIITAFTLAALVYTLNLQRQELRESRLRFEESSRALAEQNDAARDQNYQTSFFQLLATFNDIVNAIGVEDPVRKHEVRGRDAFNIVYSNIRRVYREKRENHPHAGDLKALQYAYDQAFKDAQGQLAHYFRYLYNTILLLQDSKDSSKFIKILRAQISNQELIVLYYNCAVSEPGKKFIPLAVAHKLFDNIPPLLLEPEHGKLLPDEAFGIGGYEARLREGSPRLKGDLTEAFGMKRSRRNPDIPKRPDLGTSKDGGSNTPKSPSARPARKASQRKTPRSKA